MVYVGLNHSLEDVEGSNIGDDGDVGLGNGDAFVFFVVYEELFVR